jgi:hypothetical protein
MVPWCTFMADDLQALVTIHRRPTVVESRPSRFLVTLLRACRASWPACLYSRRGGQRWLAPTLGSCERQLLATSACDTDTDYRVKVRRGRRHRSESIDTDLRLNGKNRDVREPAEAIRRGIDPSFHQYLNSGLSQDTRLRIKEGWPLDACPSRSSR